MIEIDHPPYQELITPQAVIDRVNKFLGNVDLNQEDEKPSGLFIVKTILYPDQYGPLMWHLVSANGYQVAEYSHIPDGVELEPLPEGESRIICRYVLLGYIHLRGMTSVRYEVYEGQPPQLVIYNPCSSVYTYGPPQEIPEEHQKKIADTLGIALISP